MFTEVKKRLIAGVRVLRDDRLRMHIGVALVIVGLALFGMYFPKAVHAPNTSPQTSKADKQAEVAGANVHAVYSPNDAPTHAGAPEAGQHMASIPGSDPEACAKGTSSGKTSAPTGMSGTIDVTLPVGCTSGSYELRTADGHEVQWSPLFGAFTYQDGSSFSDRGGSAYAVINVPFNKDGYKGSKINYTVTAKTTAPDSTYESALYVTDPTHKDGGYKVVLRVTVKK